MEKWFHGYCPTQNKEYAIIVTFKPTNSTQQQGYLRTSAICEYNRYGDKCETDDCPILKTVPTHITL